MEKQLVHSNLEKCEFGDLSYSLHENKIQTDQDLNVKVFKEGRCNCLTIFMLWNPFLSIYNLEAKAKSSVFFETFIQWKIA